MLLCERGLRLRTRCNKSSFIHTFSPLLLLTLSTFLPRSLTLLVARNGLRRLVSSYLQCSPFFSFLFSFLLRSDYIFRVVPCRARLTLLLLYKQPTIELYTPPTLVVSRELTPSLLCTASRTYSERTTLTTRTTPTSASLPHLLCPIYL